MERKYPINNPIYVGATPKCETVVHEIVYVQAEITITPHVEIKNLKYTCLEPIIGECPVPGKEKYNFTISQEIAVTIPLEFSAEIEAVTKGIVSTAPEVDADCK